MSGAGKGRRQVEPCGYWSDGEHAFVTMLWLDSEGFRREAPLLCCPPRRNDAPPDLKACACGAEVVPAASLTRAPAKAPLSIDRSVRRAVKVTRRPPRKGR